MRYDRNVNYSLYLISDRKVLGGRNLIESLEEAIRGGVTVVQLREKNTTSLEFYRLAAKVKELTVGYRIPLIINDRIDIALAIDAEGVHVGQNDMPANVARKILGEDKIIGVSAANIIEAKKAAKDGADYIGVGALFPTSTKKDTRAVTLGDLREIKRNVDIPVIAIGGINENNIRLVKDMGIDGVAVISSILGMENIEEAARRLAMVL